MEEKEFFNHYSGLKVSKDGEGFVPFVYAYPEHYTYGCKLKSGHLYVNYNGKKYLMHKVVAEVFLNGNKPIPKGYDVHHINGDKTDNRVENLRILTHGKHMKIHHKGQIFSEERRRKISEGLKGEKHPFFGKFGKESPRYGKHHTEEAKRKMSEAKKGKFGAEAPRSKPVIGVNKTTGEEVRFNSAREAYNELKIAYQSISKCCLGKLKSAGGYVWSYLV